MSNNLEYDGRPELSRRREIREVPVDSPLSTKEAPADFDPVDDATTSLFTNLGRTYLKGKKLQEGISLMEPAQFIPIHPDALQVSRSAERLDLEDSKGGTIIPFTLYQKCVDLLAEKQWRVRRTYEAVDMPADTESAHQHYQKEYSDSEDLENILSQFLAGDAIAGAILTGLAVTLAHNQGHQALVLEEGSKAVFTIQLQLGIAILIELGVKAARIIRLMNDLGYGGEEVEKIAEELTDPPARKAVLDQAGFEPSKFAKVQEADDATTVLEYCKSYISNHKPSDPTVYDHWIAYGSVVARNNLLRSALDTATSYSQDFSEMFDRDKGRHDDDDDDYIVHHALTEPHVRISDQIAAHFNELEKESDTVFDQILNTFMYQVTDADLCCMVEIFGVMDTGGLRLISQILKILAVDLQADIARLQDSFLKLIVNAAATAVYSVIARLTKVSDDLAINMLEAIEDIEEELGLELEHCPAFFDVGIALSFGIDAIRSSIELMLLDVLNYIEQLGSPQLNIWHVPADRRYLLTMAKILDVLAAKISAAAVCERYNEKERYEEIIGEAKDQAAHEIIHTLLDKSPPSVQISDEDIKKYFPNLAPSKSPTFKFVYGPKTIFPDRVGQRTEALNNCSGKMTEERKTRFREVISQAMTRRFKRNG
jgi:hypothetical protein